MALVGEVVARFKAETSDYMAKLDAAKSKNKELAQQLLSTAGSADKAIASLQIAKGKNALGDFGIDPRQVGGIISSIRQLDREMQNAGKGADDLGEHLGQAHKRAKGFEDITESLDRFASGNFLGGFAKIQAGLKDLQETKGTGLENIDGEIEAAKLSLQTLVDQKVLLSAPLAGIGLTSVETEIAATEAKLASLDLQKKELIASNVTTFGLAGVEAEIAATEAQLSALIAEKALVATPTPVGISTEQITAAQEKLTQLETQKAALASKAGSGLLGAAVTATVINVVASKLEEATGKAIELRDQFREGKITAGELTENLIKQIPVLGHIWGLGRNIRELIGLENHEYEKSIALQQQMLDARQKLLEINKTIAEQTEKWKDDNLELADAIKAQALEMAGMAKQAQEFKIKVKVESDLKKVQDEATKQLEANKKAFDDLLTKPVGKIDTTSATKDVKDAIASVASAGDKSVTQQLQAAQAKVNELLAEQANLKAQSTSTAPADDFGRTVGDIASARLEGVNEELKTAQSNLNQAASASKAISDSRVAAEKAINDELGKRKALIEQQAGQDQKQLQGVIASSKTALTTGIASALSPALGGLLANALDNFSPKAAEEIGKARDEAKKQLEAARKVFDEALNSPKQSQAVQEAQSKLDSLKAQQKALQASGDTKGATALTAPIDQATKALGDARKALEAAIASKTAQSVSEAGKAAQARLDGLTAQQKSLQGTGDTKGLSAVNNQIKSAQAELSQAQAEAKAIADQRAKSEADVNATLKDRIAIIQKENGVVPLPGIAGALTGILGNALSGAKSATQQDSEALGKSIADTIRKGLEGFGITSTVNDFMKGALEAQKKAQEEAEAKAKSFREKIKTEADKLSEELDEAIKLEKSGNLSPDELSKVFGKDKADLEKELKDTKAEERDVFKLPDVKEIRSGQALFAPPTRIEEKSLEKLEQIKNLLDLIEQKADDNGITIEEIN